MVADVASNITEGVFEGVSDAASDVFEGVAPLVVDKLSPLITIFKAVGIAILVYVIFLIIRAVFRWRTVSKLGKIAKNVQEINEKFDVLIKGRAKPKKEKREKINSLKS